MATETLRPDAAGDECTIRSETGPACPNHYLNVDEEIHDEHTTRVRDRDQVNYFRDLYKVEDHSVGSGTINHVTVYAVCIATGTIDQDSLKIAIKAGTGAGAPDTPAESVEKTLDGSWTLYSNQWANNPATTDPWTWDEIDKLQAGIALRSSSSLSALYSICTQVYVEVDYIATYDESATVAVGLASSAIVGHGRDAIKATGLATTAIAGQGRTSIKAIGLSATAITGQGRNAISAIGLATTAIVGQGRSATKAIGLNASATRTMAYGRTALKAVGLSTIAIAGQGRIAIKAVGLVATATRALTIKRTTIKAVGLATTAIAGQSRTSIKAVGLSTAAVVGQGRVAIKAIGLNATAMVGHGRTALKAIGLSTTAIVGHGRTAISAVGLSATATRLMAYGRIATTAIGLVATAVYSIDAIIRRYRVRPIEVWTTAIDKLGRYGKRGD